MRCITWALRQESRRLSRLNPQGRRSRNERAALGKRETTMTSRSGNRAIGWVEQGLVPDPVVRLGIRRLLKDRLVEIGDGDGEASARIEQAFVASLASSAVALLTEKANEQHYEVPAAFFARVLGPHRKYSCCEWRDDTKTLADAEAAALATTCERAGLVDGQRILELGCGWGSLSLWMAERYPASRITALSNSHSQRRLHRTPGGEERGLSQPAASITARRQRRSGPTSVSIASSRSRCSSTCATGPRPFAASPAGWCRVAVSSCTCSCTARRPMPSSSATRPTG